MPSSLTGIFGKLYEMRTARQRAIVTTVDSFLILSSSSPTPSIWVITSCVEANLKLGDENFLNLKTFKVHYKCLLMELDLNWKTLQILMLWGQ